MGHSLERRQPDGPVVVPPPALGDEFEPAEFPPKPMPPQWARLEQLTAVAEEVSGMPGLSTYLQTTAKAESDGIPSAFNTAADGPPALRQLYKRRNFNHRFANNPWRPHSADTGDPLAARWAYSGGWFGLMPVIALATDDRRALRHDPARVFDPVFAVAYATDLVYRLCTRHQADTWGEVRARWILHDLCGPQQPTTLKSRMERRRTVRMRFLRELVAHNPGCNSSNLASQTVNADRYPGFTWVLWALRRAAAEG